MNYITKRPTNKDFTKIKAQVGTDSFWRTDLDLNRSLAQGRVNTRLVAAWENSLAWAKPSGGDSWLLAGAVDFKLGKNASLVVDFETYNRDQTPLIGMKPNLQVAGFNTASAANYPNLSDRARAQGYIDVGNLNLGFLNYPPLANDFNYVGNNDYRTSWFDSLNAELNVASPTACAKRPRRPSSRR